MKYLFLMGGSGCGKTTLAMNLDANAPDKFHRVLQVTTRPKRENEVEMKDYEFLSDDEYDKVKDLLFETVEFQMPQGRYGARKSELVNDKWNVVVVSIEGFLSAVKSLQPTDTAVLINILLDDVLDVSRDGRDPLAEEKINKGVLKSLRYDNQIIVNGRKVFYTELSLSTLKRIRAVPQLYIPFIENTIKNLISNSLEYQLRNARSYDELILLFVNNSSAISNSNKLLDILDYKAVSFKKSIKELCDDALLVVRGMNSND